MHITVNCKTPNREEPGSSRTQAAALRLRTTGKGEGLGLQWPANKIIFKDAVSGTSDKHGHRCYSHTFIEGASKKPKVKLSQR